MSQGPGLTPTLGTGAPGTGPGARTGTMVVLGPLLLGLLSQGPGLTPTLGTGAPGTMTGAGTGTGAGTVSLLYILYIELKVGP